MDPLTNREYWQLIWDKFRAGDRHAFETIYNEYIDVLYSYGSRITSDKSLLCDAIQDLFVNIYTYSKGLHTPESLEYYLIKTLKHILLRKLCDNKHYIHPEKMPEQFNLKFPLEQAEQEVKEENLVLLQKELLSLDARKRELLFLKFNSGLTYNEIGQLLGIKPDTVKKQVYRILDYLRGKLKKKIVNLFVVSYKSLNNI
ncbi:MAG: sigma-70 family RNA polymerase sigma factor [Bacteroidales bacterium]|nr:sigma-70 family RNA polymerase sigma factor [Bacteroidales bacterium]